jgi:hypothetical protein
MATSSVGFYTNSIDINEGDIIIAYTDASDTMCAIAQNDGQGGYVPINIGKSSAGNFVFYYHIAEENSSYTISGYSRYFNQHSVYVLSKDSIINFIFKILSTIDIDSIHDILGVDKDSIIPKTKNIGYIPPNHYKK